MGFFVGFSIRQGFALNNRFENYRSKILHPDVTFPSRCSSYVVKEMKMAKPSEDEFAKTYQSYFGSSGAGKEAQNSLVWMNG